MKILITGGSGLLGQYLNIILSENNHILTLFNSNPGNCEDYLSHKTDITDLDELNKIVSEFRPDVVIHTAAISRPEKCDELSIETVNDTNVKPTIRLSELCDKYKSKLIFTSTDLVYDGDRGQMLKESDVLKPVSLYAETKISSEEGVRNIFGNYIILRTSLLYGLGLNHSINNFHQMFYNFKNDLPVKLFYDQFRSPLSLIDASELINNLMSPDFTEMTLNFGGLERVSRCELGEILCELGNFDNSLIIKTSMYDIPALHKVADVSMNTEKLNSLGLKQKSIEESIHQILKHVQ